MIAALVLLWQIYFSLTSTALVQKESLRTIISFGIIKHSHDPHVHHAEPSLPWPMTLLGLTSLVSDRLSPFCTSPN